MLVSHLIQELSKEQASGHEKFPPGFFPAYRRYPYLGLERSDDNLFCTALTIAKLQHWLPSLSTDKQNVINSIVDKARTNYSNYRVWRRESWVYQFWREGSGLHFPNGKLLRHFKKFKSPPDADDTALAYLSYPHTQAETLAWKHYLQTFANGEQKWNTKMPTPLRIPKVYSTWMGTGAMPVEFDVVVLSNVLRCFHHYGLPLNEYDEASILFLCRVISTGDYVHQPFYLAPWYPSSILIHYYLVQLLTETQWPQIDALRSVLIDHWHTISKQATNFVEKVLLCNSALRLGIPTSPIQIPPNWPQTLYFTCYTGGMLTALHSRAAWAIAKWPIFHWRFSCNAYALSILLEYQMLMHEQEANL